MAKPDHKHHDDGHGLGDMSDDDERAPPRLLKQTASKRSFHHDDDNSAHARTTSAQVISAWKQLTNDDNDDHNKHDDQDFMTFSAMTAAVSTTTTEEEKKRSAYGAVSTTRTQVATLSPPLLVRRESLEMPNPLYWTDEHDQAQYEVWMRPDVQDMVRGFPSGLMNALLCMVLPETSSHIALDISHLVGVEQDDVLVSSLVQSIPLLFNLSCAVIRCHPSMEVTDIAGAHRVYTPASMRTQQLYEMTENGYLTANVLVVHDIHLAPERVQSFLMQVMHVGHVILEGANVTLPANHGVMATYRQYADTPHLDIPVTLMDEFIVASRTDVLSLPFLVQFVSRLLQQHQQLHCDPISSRVPLADMRKALKALHCCQMMRQYMRDVIICLRHHSVVATGPSLRCSKHLVIIAKLNALLSARDYVQPDDIIRVAADVMSHRIVLRQRATPSVCHRLIVHMVQQVLHPPK